MDYLFGLLWRIGISIPFIALFVFCVIVAFANIAFAAAAFREKNIKEGFRCIGMSICFWALSTVIVCTYVTYI